MFAHAAYEDAYAREGMQDFLDVVHKQMRLSTLLNLTLICLNSALLFAVTAMAIWLWTLDAVSVGYSNLTQLPQRQTFQTIWLCDYVDGDIRLNPSEHDNFAWIKKNEFYQIDAIEFLKSFVASEVFNSQI